ncbi:metallophosphoesterase family protein [Paenibacillus aestuarii]|uniref:Metallophosphoesterase family protein n=1 Tax=Paenibacillus aestuarii TaxID=516965 RepID=A0ABW0KGW7_9BACL|nr:metallophosphoesterase [Paenibacillus aestuarii]
MLAVSVYSSSAETVSQYGNYVVRDGFSENKSSYVLENGAQLPSDEANSLNKSGENQPLLSFPVLSDIHVQSWDEQSKRKFAAALQDLDQINPHADTLVINGDMTNGMPADYRKLAQILVSNPHPDRVEYAIGNHEFYEAWFDDNRAWSSETFPNGETEQASIDRFLQLTGEHHVFYDREINGYSFIFLGMEHYRQSDPANLEDAYLSKEQLDWLQAKLQLSAKADGQKPIFVFLHQPLPNTVAGTRLCCTNNRAVIQNEELRKIFSQFPQIIFFSGHTHWELKLPETFVRDTFTMVNSASTEQLWTDNGSGGEVEMGPDESQGLYVEVYPDKVKIKGRDFYRQSWIPEAQFEVPVGKIR